MSGRAARLERANKSSQFKERTEFHVEPWIIDIRPAAPVSTVQGILADEVQSSGDGHVVPWAVVRRHKEGLVGHGVGDD